MPETPFINTAAVASYLGLSRSTLEKLRCRGGGPPYVLLSRRRVVYDRDAVKVWAKSREYSSTSEYAPAVRPSDLPTRSDFSAQ